LFLVARIPIGGFVAITLCTFRRSFDVRQKKLSWVRVQHHRVDSGCVSSEPSIHTTSASVVCLQDECSIRSPRTVSACRRPSTRSCLSDQSTMGLPSLRIVRGSAGVHFGPEVAADTTVTRQTVAAEAWCRWGSCCNVCYSCTSRAEIWMLTFLSRLEEASDPDSLSQETIIDNLSAEEAHRLSKVRNIGIAVS